MRETDKEKFERISKAYNKFERSFIQSNYGIELEQPLRTLSEADLEKVTNDALDLLCTKKGDVPELRSIKNLPVVISRKHLKSKAKERFIRYIPARRLITNEMDYIMHIAEILRIVFDNYKDSNGVSLDQIIKRIFKHQFPDIDDIEDWYDDEDDIKIKLSTYRIFNHESKLFMIEGAIAVGISAFSLNGKTLDCIRNKYEYLWDDVIDINNKYPGQLIDLNALCYHPVLTVTSYSTWIKQITSKTDFTMIPNSLLGNESLTELFQTKLTDPSYIYSIKYNNDLINNEVDDKTFDELCKFEQERPKGD